MKLTTHLHLDPKLIMPTTINYPHLWLQDKDRENFNLYVNTGLSIMMDPVLRRNEFHEKRDTEM